LLLLAAANATDLLSQLEVALPMKQQNAAVQGPAPQHLFQPQLRLLLTLLFLNAVGLHRPWDLRNYTGSELGRLSGRTQPYSYRHVECFLRIFATANADEAFTAALAGWTSTLWQVKAANLAMWVRDRFFPSTYAHATWQRLQPFFRLPDRVHWGQEVVQVEVRPFNNRQLTRDLLAVCQRVNELQPQGVSLFRNCASRVRLNQFASIAIETRERTTQLLTLTYRLFFL